MASIYGPLLNSFMIKSTTIPEWIVTLLQTGTLGNYVVNKYGKPLKISPKNENVWVEMHKGISIEVEPLDETPLEDLGLNTCNHDIPLSSREIPSFDEPKPQPQPVPSFPSLEVDLGEERGPKQSIKPPSLDSFRMKEVDHFTNHTPPSPYAASFHPKDTYCYYHSCMDDPKKNYGFKLGLLGQSGSLGVDLLKLEMIEDDWEIGFKEVSFLGRGLSSLVRPKEVEKVIFDEKKLGSS
ncbi:hypothetical protein Tco_0504814 [Tanacetum coccineum]